MLGYSYNNDTCTQVHVDESWNIDDFSVNQD